MPPGRDKNTLTEERRSTGPSSDERQRELDRRRSYGYLACADCNRLKLRCDKKIPCSTCVRRGTSTTCPTGNSVDKRPTDPVRRKLLDMSGRIRALEDALAISTANSTSCHPLLQPALLAIKHVSEIVDAEDECTDSTPEGGLPDLSSLTISENGAPLYTGRMGGSNNILISGFESEGTSNSNLTGLYGNQQPVPQALTEKKQTDTRISETIVQLPPRERAWTLCETYLQHVTWMVCIAERDQIINELLIPIYTWKDAYQHNPDLLPSVHPHDLALLLMVLATGALVDLTIAPSSEEAERFYLLAQSNFDLYVVAECPSLASVQVLSLMSVYLSISDESAAGRSFASPIRQEKSFSANWFGAVLGLTMGLHRDPEKWELDEKMKERRRLIYWQLHMMQNWQSIATGRPVMYDTRCTDCQLPREKEMKLGLACPIEVSIWHWRFEFVRKILSQVNAVTCKVGDVKYTEITDLDRKLRELGIPEHLQAPPEGYVWVDDGPYHVMLRLTPTLWHHVVVLLLHSTFFAKAISECPQDPLTSEYAPSFLSSYRSAQVLLTVARNHYPGQRDILVRMWLYWKHVFSSLAIMGMIVIRAPNCSFATTALAELAQGVIFFEKWTVNATWAPRTMSILTTLREKAVHAYNQSRSAAPRSAPRETDRHESAPGPERISATHLMASAPPSTVSAAQPHIDAIPSRTSAHAPVAMALPHPARALSRAPAHSFGPAVPAISARGRKRSAADLSGDVNYSFLPQQQQSRSQFTAEPIEALPSVPIETPLRGGIYQPYAAFRSIAPAHAMSGNSSIDFDGIDPTWATYWQDCGVFQASDTGSSYQ